MPSLNEKKMESSSLEETTCKFVSQKIRKIRWKPPPKESLQPPEYFVTGSWDDDVNNVCLWNYTATGASSDTDIQKDMEPKLISEIAHPGDVTDLQFLNTEFFVGSSSNGSVFLYRVHRNQTLKLTQTWEHIHTFGSNEEKPPRFRNCPCTSFTTRNDDIITAGEDGRLVHLNTKHKEPIRVIDGGESCTINDILFLKQFEVVTANMRGQLKVWDIRAKHNAPSQKFFLSGEQVGLHCLAQHPSQPQIIATGGEDGTLIIWDMRQDKYPVTLLSAHKYAMLEVKFHPDYPNHLFTCSQDGSLWHWDCSGISQTQLNPFLKSNKVQDFQPMDDTNPWLSCDATKHRLDIRTLLPDNRLPINSLDVASTTLLCGADNESFYIIQNLSVKK